MISYKAITADKVKDKIYLQQLSNSTIGAHLDGTPVVFDENTDVKELGKGILEVLEKSQTSPDYQIDKDSIKYIWEEAGFKTWKPFAKKAYSISIVQLDNEIKFIPTKLNTKPISFLFTTKKQIITEDFPHENLGRCLLEALSRCENIYLDKPQT